METALFNPVKTYLCYYSQQTKQITVLIHLNQRGRLLNFDRNAFHTCLVLKVGKMRWFFYFVILAQTFHKTRLEMSALLLRKCIKTKNITQINDIWIWIICKAVISSTLFGSRRWILRTLKEGMKLQSSPKVMSSRFDFSFLFPKSLHCGRHTWNYSASLFLSFTQIY